MSCRDSSDELDAVWLLGGSAARLARWCGAVAVERRCGSSAAHVAPGAGQQAAARQRGGGGIAPVAVAVGERRVAARCAAAFKKGSVVLYIKK